MKLAVLGGNGPTGLHVVDQALQQGHEVTALVRNAAALPARPGLTVVQGTPMSAQDVEKAVEGKEAVLSVLGARSLKRTELYSTSGRNVVAAMRRHGAKRFVVTSSAGVEDDDPSMEFFYKWVVRPLFLQRLYDDCRRMEALLREAQDIEWICVRPTELTDGPRTGSYRVSPRFAPEGKGARISRADVAEFMLKQLRDTQYLRGTPTLAY